MVQIIGIYLLLVGLVACSQQPSSPPLPPISNNTNAPSVSPAPTNWIGDTILEQNNPIALDLSTHQVFIDTTKNSVFYSKLEDWEPSEWTQQTINSCLATINTNFQPTKIKLDNFPTHFITLRKLNNQFVLYDRCDGIDQRFELRDSAVVFYGPLESYAASIVQMHAPSKHSIHIQLKHHPNTAAYQDATFIIEQLAPTVYQLHYRSPPLPKSIYLTTLDAIHEFDLVVNHCPITKRLEVINHFDTE